MSSNASKRTKTPKNTAIYITGLPTDTTIDEASNYFSKCGIIMDEIGTGKPRIRLYTQESDPSLLKGDALVVYLREESVTLASNLLDESEFRPGIKITVQPAQREATNESVEVVPEKRPKVDKETWKKHMKRMQKRLEWFDEDAEAAAREDAKLARWSKIVVLKQMFTKEELEADPLEFPLLLAEEIESECQDKLGVDKCSVQIVSEMAETGVCTVKFASELEAVAAVKLMNGRFFDGRRVEASIYDGSFDLPKKKLSVAEEDEAARLEQFSQFIEKEEESEEGEEEEEDFE